MLGLTRSFPELSGSTVISTYRSTAPSARAEQSRWRCRSSDYSARPSRHRKRRYRTGTARAKKLGLHKAMILFAIDFHVHNTTFEASMMIPLPR